MMFALRYGAGSRAQVVKALVGYLKRNTKIILTQPAATSRTDRVGHQDQPADQVGGTTRFL